MVSYVVAPILSVFFCLLGDLWHRSAPGSNEVRGDGRRWTGFDFLAVAFLVAHQGTRYYVGTDYFTYRQIFDNLIPGAFAPNVEKVPQEPLYTITSVLVRSASDDFTVLFLVMAVLAIVPAYHALLTGTALPSVALSFYVLTGTYLLGFNVVRQAIAIGLVLLVYAWHARRPFLAALVGLIAIGFHFAAAVPLVIILIYSIARSRSRTFFVVTVLVAALAGAGSLVATGGSTTLYGFSFVQSRYSGYLDVAGFSTGRAVLLGAFVILFLCSWGMGGQNRFPRWMGLLGILGMVVGLNYVFVGRISWYFLVFLLVPLAGRSRSSWSWVFRVAALSAAVIVYVSTIMTSAELLPYSSWLFADQ